VAIARTKYVSVMVSRGPGLLLPSIPRIYIYVIRIYYLNFTSFVAVFVCGCVSCESAAAAI